MYGLLLLSKNIDHSLVVQFRNQPWIYLGSQDLTVQRWEFALGKSQRIRLGYDFEKSIENFQPEYLEWIEQLAAGEQDMPAFWKMTFSARNPETSEFNTLFYYALYVSIARIKNPNLHIVVEDPWLYTALAERFGNARHLRHAKRQIAAYKTKAILKLPFARVMFVLRGLSRLMLSRLFGLSKSVEKNSVALVSYAFSKQIAQRPYQDPFFGNLPDILAELGKDPYYVFPLHTSSRLFQRISQIPNARVIAGYSCITALAKAVFAWCKRIHAERKIEGVDLSPLIERERWIENTTNRYVYSTWQTLAWNRFPKSGFETVISIFENHPWEKSMIHGLKSAKIKSIGYQHSTITNILSNYYPVKGEEDFYPDLIVANTLKNKETLEARGWKKPIYVGGTFRFRPNEGLGSKKKRNLFPVLLVALPGVKKISDVLLSVLGKIDGYNTQILIKPHPTISVTDVSQIRNATLTTSSIYELAKKIDAVLFTSSTIGLEALALGVPAARYVPEAIITLDPIPSDFPLKADIVDDNSLAGWIKNLDKVEKHFDASKKAKALLYYPPTVENWRTILLQINTM